MVRKGGRDKVYIRHESDLHICTSQIRFHAYDRYQIWLFLLELAPNLLPFLYTVAVLPRKSDLSPSDLPHPQHADTLLAYFTLETRIDNSES